MRFLLDTDVLSNLRKAKPHPVLLDWLGRLDESQIGITTTSIFEIQMGIEKLGALGDKVRARDIERWLESLLATRTAQIIPHDAAVARLQAKLFSAPGLQNFVRPAPNSPKPKFGADLVVAATAIIHQTAIATFNVGDFLRIDAFARLPGLFHPGRPEWVIPPRTPA